MRALAGLALCAALLPACGYTAGARLGPERERLGIELFANDGRVPDLERALHVQLTRAARDLIDGDVVRPSEAQVLMRGRIEGYRTRGGVRDSNNRLLESGVEVSVSAALVSPAGAPLTREVRAATWVGFTRDRQEAEEDAVERALRNLAERVVLDLALLSRQPPPTPEGP